MSGWMRQGKKDAWLKVQPKNGEMDFLGKVGLIGFPVGLSLLGGFLLIDHKEEVLNALDSAVSIGEGIGLSGFALLAGYAGLKGYQLYQKEDVVALELKPKATAKPDPQKVAAMVKEFRQLYKRFFLKRQWLRWQIVRDQDGKFSFRLLVPKKHKNVIKIRLENAYPDCFVIESSPDLPSFYDPYLGDVAHLRLRHGKERGLNQSLHNGMGDILSLMGNESILEVAFSPSSVKPIRKAIKKEFSKLKKQTDDKELLQRILERNKGDRTAFDCYISIWGKYGIDSLIGELSAKTEGLNKLTGKPYRFLDQYRNSFNWDDRLKPLPFWRKSLLTDQEIAPLFFLPTRNHPIWQHIPQEAPRPFVGENEFKGQYGIGKLDTDNPVTKGKIARLKTRTLTNHGLIAGASGGGKGSALMQFVKTDFLQRWIDDRNSMGITICDPHTEDILLILNRLLEMEKEGIEVPWDRVKVASFGEIGANNFPVAANLLYVPDSEKVNIDRIAEICSEVILNTFDSSSLSQSVAYLERAFQALLYRKQQSSLLDITRLFRYSAEGLELRQQAIEATKNKNPIIWEAWSEIHYEIQKDKKDKKVNAIDTRLTPLLAKKSMQRFFCRDGNYFSQVPDFIRSGDLVLVDFRGASNEIFRLCAAWLANLYFHASQDRGSGGRSHLLIFDEVQKFSATDSFFKILSENRKFNMGLILMTQEVEALDQKLKSSLKQNAGMILSVRQSGDGAKAMAQLLGEPFSADELSNLVTGREAAIKSFDGKARLLLDYPSYVLDGKECAMHSREEAIAKDAAREKFLELLARDHKTVKEADQEIRRFVGLAPEPKQQSEGDSNSETQKSEAGVSQAGSLRRVK